MQETAKGGYNWAGLDEGVEIAARAGLRVLPFLYGTPRWLAAKPTTLPIDSAGRGRPGRPSSPPRSNATARGGEFWAEHAPGGVGVDYEPAIPRPLPIRTWQIWNEANFFYFACPASPSRYARLVTLPRARRSKPPTRARR